MSEEVTIEQPAPPAEEPKTEAPEGEVVLAEGEQPEGEVKEEETPEQQEAKKQSKFQRRLERQKTARIAAETEARLLRERVAALEAAAKPAPKDEAPKREDFADDVAYLEARADHAARKAAAEVREADRKASEGQQRQSKQQEVEARIAESWTKRETAFQATAKDYVEIVEPFVQDDLGHFSDGTKRLIVESEVGPQLLYHLATHPDDAERIAELSPVRQIAELGKLEEKMQKPVRRTSSAPAPIDPIPPGRSGSKDPAKMNVAEYAKWMKDNGSRYVR